MCCTECGQQGESRTIQNKEYPLSIPAGYDMSVLEEADWYGVLYLNQFFGVANQ